MIVNALIWDYDGTIGDTFEKNLRITRDIVETITGKSAHDFPVLRTLETYALAHTRIPNWREFYRFDLGLTEDETNEAGRLWAEYQLKDGIPTPLYPGIPEVFDRLQQFPHGIVSQNARSTIEKTLKTADLLRHFASIIGYEEVQLRKQKPDPDGLLLCIDQLTASAPGVVLYIGDHEVDIETAINANRVSAQRHLNLRVVSVAAAYGAHVDHKRWRLTPDYIVRDPAEVLDLVRGIDPERVDP